MIKVTEAGARIDFGYHFIISTEAQLASVPTYATDFGAPSFKIFMNNRGGEGKRLGLPDIDDGFLLRLCEAAARSGGIVCPHPENIEMSWVLRDRLRAADPDGKGGLASWNASRPPFVEADAVQRAGLIAQATGCGLYIVHTTSAAALEAALSARARGCRIAIETCPHYLTHDVSFAGGDTGKINPPLREAADREALWAGIANGKIDTVATDHVHRDLAGKAGGIWSASPGCPGLETLLAVMLSEGHFRRGLPLQRIAEVLAHNPAQEMGLGIARAGSCSAMTPTWPSSILNEVGGSIGPMSSPPPAIRSMRVGSFKARSCTRWSGVAQFTATVRRWRMARAGGVIKGGEH